MSLTSRPFVQMMLVRELSYLAMETVATGCPDTTEITQCVDLHPLHTLAQQLDVRILVVVVVILE
jgi:hypothetical protein